MAIINKHTSFATFVNNFSSLLVYGPFSLSISVRLTAGDVPSPIMGTQTMEQVTQCHCEGVNLYLRVQDTQGQAFLGRLLFPHLG